MDSNFFSNYFHEIAIAKYHLPVLCNYQQLI